MSNERANRRELAHFLRSRRERIKPDEAGLPGGPRRRTRGLRREEVAVLAGVSASWYTYLEQGRKIGPSPEVLDSLARVLRMTEDERRYMHVLAYGQVSRPAPLIAASAGHRMLLQVMALVADSPYPVYAGDHRGDLLAWNRAATEWYGDWAELAPAERNIIWWMLLSPQARLRLVDWETDVRDSVARWRAESAKWPGDERTRELLAELARRSPEFGGMWESQEVLEHRSRARRFDHPVLGLQTLRILPVSSMEFPTSAIIFHLPLEPGD
jgi:transcriptional regulator with XRE-family HTH domain